MLTLNYFHVSNTDSGAPTFDRFLQTDKKYLQVFRAHPSSLNSPAAFRVFTRSEKKSLNIQPNGLGHRVHHHHHHHHVRHSKPGRWCAIHGKIAWNIHYKRHLKKHVAPKRFYNSHQSSATNGYHGSTANYNHIFSTQFNSHTKTHHVHHHHLQNGCNNQNQLLNTSDRLERRYHDYRKNLYVHTLSQHTNHYYHHHSIHLVNGENDAPKNCNDSGNNNNFKPSQNLLCDEKIFENKPSKRSKSMQTLNDSGAQFDPTTTETVMRTSCSETDKHSNGNVEDGAQEHAKKNNEDQKTFHHHDSSSFIRPIHSIRTLDESGPNSQRQYCQINEKVAQNGDDFDIFPIKTEPEDDKEVTDIFYRNNQDVRTARDITHLESKKCKHNSIVSCPSYTDDCKFSTCNANVMRNHNSTSQTLPYTNLDYNNADINNMTSASSLANDFQNSYSLFTTKIANIDQVNGKPNNKTNVDLQLRTPSSGSDSSTVSSFENFKSKMDAKYTYEDKMKNYQKYLNLDSQIARDNKSLCRENYRRSRKSTPNHNIENDIYKNIMPSRVPCSYLTDRRSYKINNNFELDNKQSAKTHVVCPKGSGGSDSSCSSDTGNKNQQASESLSTGDRDSLSSNSSNDCSPLETVNDLEDDIKPKIR